jgi:hypothetical protein
VLLNRGRVERWIAAMDAVQHGSERARAREGPKERERASEREGGREGVRKEESIALGSLGARCVREGARDVAQRRERSELRV